jgi:chromate transporter
VVPVAAGPLRLELPRLASLDPAALLLALAAAVATFRYRVGMLATLGGAAALGLAWRLLSK